MFCVFDGGSRIYTEIAEGGIGAVRERERLGLPVDTSGMVYVYIDKVCDRRAAESWPEALNSSADLPSVRTDEFRAMLAAGLVGFVGPEKDGSVVGLRAQFTCTTFEMVQWRRAWAAEQRAKDAEKRLKEMEKAAQSEVESDEPDDE